VSGITLGKPDDALSNIELNPVFSEFRFDNAVFLIAVPESNRLAVVEQAGRVKVFENSSNASEPEIILDVSDTILFRREQGLLGMAFDPDFSQNRYVYINYSMQNPRRNVVSRMIWDPVTDQLLRQSEQIIIEFEQPYANHNGGMLAFGPDGYLYIGVGDGGSSGDPLSHGQNRTTLLGSILRLDVHPENSEARYAIPASNPFANSSCCRAEIYAFGWRNPYRFSFDRVTGDLWAADVGQNKIEEINTVVAGGNYGWNRFEGSEEYELQQNDSEREYIRPVFEYDHRFGSSITGGYVYRGGALSELLGRYLYADYVSGSVWALGQNNDGDTRNTLLGSVLNPTSFGESNDGELFVVTHNTGLYKIQSRARP